MTTTSHSHDASELLVQCAQHSEDRLPRENELALVGWFEARCKTTPSMAAFAAAAPPEWEQMVLEHPAHQHAWYDYIENGVTLDEVATFLLENRHYPVFLRLLESIRAAQI